MDANELKSRYEDMESAEQKLKIYEEYSNHISKTESLEVIKPIIDSVANASVSGDIADAEVRAHATTLANIDKTPLTKSDVIELIESKKEEITKRVGSSNSVILPLDEWLIENVDEVTVSRSTDSTVDTTYTWHFKDQENAVDTASEHNSFESLSDKLYEQYSIQTFQPQVTDNKDWKNWIQSFIKKHQDVNEFVGARTQVIEELQRRLSDSDAYTDLEVAFKRGRVYYDSGDEFYLIPNDLVSSICEDYGITNKALQIELQNNGWIEGGCSVERRVNSKISRFWKLPDEFADANPIDPEETEFETSRYASGSK